MRSNVDESVERYLSGTMSEEERRAFAASVASNADAQKLLAADRVIERSFVASSVPNDAAHTIPNPALTSYLSETHPTHNNRWVALAWIAAFLITISGLVYLTTEYSSLSQAPLSPQPTPIATDTITIAMPPAHNQTEESTIPATEPSHALRQKQVQTLNETPAPPKIYKADSVTLGIHGH